MNALEKAMAKINSEYKAQIIQQGTESVYVEKIPFSSPKLNYQTYGGVPVGKATEFFGTENGGKTTTALVAVAGAQQLALKQYNEKHRDLESRIAALEGRDLKSEAKTLARLISELTLHEADGPRKVVYVDAENTLDEEWATLLGVDVAALILMRPQEQSAEQVLQDMLDLMATGLVIMMVLDSVPMLVSQKLLKPDSTLEDKAYGGIADTLAEFSRKASSLISRNHIALILINQLREDLNNPYNQYKTPGGRALKHFFALRLYFRKGDFFDDKGAKLKQSAETPAGNLVDVHVVKTKVCKPDRRIGYYTLSYTDGVDVIGDTIDMAIKYDLIVQSGAWFRLINEDGEILEGPDGEELKFQGRPALLEYLRDDSEIFDELYDAVLERLK